MKSLISNVPQEGLEDEDIFKIPHKRPTKFSEIIKNKRHVKIHVPKTLQNKR